MPGNLLTHPKREVLTAFGLGKLSPIQSRSVEAHIAECEPCCETLFNLQSDTFVDLVRSSNADSDHCQRQPEQVERPELADTDAIEVPTELADHSRYRAIELLGRGGMGKVYKAEHRLMNRLVALKVINPGLLAEPMVIERFRREVQAAAQLTHPNIVTAYDAEQAGDTHLLVIEYVDGTDLGEFVKQRGPLSVEVAVDLIRQTASGLQHAHDCGMVHRDIKPQNLMVNSEGTLKILDFGLAALATRDMARSADDRTNIRQGNSSNCGNSDSPVQHRLTNVGCTMGTPDFISPEQVRDAHAVDARSDIYSLGCTLYFLLAGHPPFPHGSSEAKLDAHVRRQPERIESLRENVPEKLADVLRRMMDKDEAKRFQTVSEVMTAIAPFASSDSSLEQQTAEFPKTMEVRGRGARSFGWGVIVAAIVGLLLPSAMLIAHLSDATKDGVKGDMSVAMKAVAQETTPQSTEKQSAETSPSVKSSPNVNESQRYPSVFHSPASDVAPQVFESVFQLEMVVRTGSQDAKVEYANGTVVSADGIIASVISQPATSDGETLNVESATLLMLDGSSITLTFVRFEPMCGVAIFRAVDAELPNLTLSKSSLIPKRRVTWHTAYRNGRKTYLYTRPLQIYEAFQQLTETSGICGIIDPGTSALSAERSGSPLVALDGSVLALMGRQKHWTVTKEKPRQKLAWAVPAQVIANLVESSVER